MPSLSRFPFPSWIPVSVFWYLGSRAVSRTIQHWLWHSVLSRCHSSPHVHPFLHSSLFYQIWTWTLETPCGLRWLHTCLQRAKRAGTPCADMACFLSFFFSPRADADRQVAALSWKSDKERWKAQMHSRCQGRSEDKALLSPATLTSHLCTVDVEANLLHKTNPWDNTNRFCFAHSGKWINVPENYKWLCNLVFNPLYLPKRAIRKCQVDINRQTPHDPNPDK